MLKQKRRKARIRKKKKTLFQREGMLWQPSGSDKEQEVQGRGQLVRREEAKLYTAPACSSLVCVCVWGAKPSQRVTKVPGEETMAGSPSGQPHSPQELPTHFGEWGFSGDGSEAAGISCFVILNTRGSG